MAEAQSNVQAILAALAAAQGGAPATPNQPATPYAAPGYPTNPPSNAYSAIPANTQPLPYATGAYPMPAAPGFDLSAIRPVNSGTVNIGDAIAQARNFAADQGLTPYEQPPSGSYQAYDARAAVDSRHYRSRSRSPPARRDAYRDNFNPYRDERRNDRAVHPRDYGRDRSMSPGFNRNRSSGGVFSPRGHSGRDRGGDDDDSEIIEIESSLVGLIIGRQGENLRRVESETSCRVQFLSPSGEPGQFRQCKITGARARRAEAKAAINRIIDDSGMGALARGGGGGHDRPPQTRREANPPAPNVVRDGEACMQIMVPDRTVGLIIGRGGETIRDLQERSGCHINIVSESQSVDGLRPVNLIGSDAAAEQAKEFILEIVASDSRNVNNNNNNNSGSNDGSRTRPQRNDPSAHDSNQGSGDRINDSIYVPSEAVGMIIGRGGETIREMQNTTTCKINVSSQSGPGEVEREIGLVGSREAIESAKRAIQDKVDAVRQNSRGNSGGRGGRTQSRRDWDNPNYSQPQQALNSQSGTPASAPASAAAGASGANGASDPYAICKSSPVISPFSRPSSLSG
ncbi:hypothetical protein GGR54DRAFT_206986 [Hypoxylon sp. NC1633]|nr:hypothetical protein GGR54DRAFT_206986 [Hypoxylon sp. NC1633]